MTCRDEVIAAFQRLSHRYGRDEFSLDEVTAEVLAASSAYLESTIRTHVTSRMCRQAPAHHGTVYGDLERVDYGIYRLRSG